jgi:hypothetical protein
MPVLGPTTVAKSSNRPRAGCTSTATPCDASGDRRHRRHGVAGSHLSPRVHIRAITSPRSGAIHTVMPQCARVAVSLGAARFYRRTCAYEFVRCTRVRSMVPIGGGGSKSVPARRTVDGDPIGHCRAAAPPISAIQARRRRSRPVGRPICRRRFIAKRYRLTV